jgi:hypothetical protein
MAYNMMKYYEFASDQYASVGLFHHFEGLLFNKVPLIKKLKWREVVTGKALWGSVNDRNRNTLIFPSTLHALGAEPYVELTAGIENIFKVFRVDFLYRATYQSPKASNNIGVKAGFQLTF